MSSERVNSNKSGKKLDKSLANLEKNKAPLFRSNPFSPKENSIVNLSFSKNCSSFSPAMKFLRKESIALKKIKIDNKSLNKVENEKITEASNHKLNDSQSGSRSNSKPNNASVRPSIDNFKLLNSQQNQTKSNSHQIKNDFIKTKNIVILNHGCSNLINNLNSYTNGNIPNSTTNDKTSLNNNFLTIKLIGEPSNNTLDKLNNPCQDNNLNFNLVNKFQPPKPNYNSIPKPNRIVISMKKRTKLSSPVTKEKIDSKLIQYQRNIKLNSKLNLLVNQRMFNLSHSIRSPQKDVSILKSYENIPHNVSYQNYFANINNYEFSKFGLKPNGIVTTYAANTNQGLFRNYNEDRVSIILNVIKPNSRKNEDWPKCSFFAIFDGHGGDKCADFLKENLHQYIFRESCFHYDPKKAIMKGFEAAEKSFSKLMFPGNSINNNDIDRSGSCALVIIILDNICYVANLGDSRALYSEDCSKKVYLISKDHKPNEENEKKRIEMNGGFIYQGQLNSLNKPVIFNNKMPGPYRLFPGRLSVSRSFGDIEAKLPELGGNPKVLIALPDIISFRIKEDADFLVLGSDGIFDKLTNKDIMNCIWSCTNEEIFIDDINQLSGRCVDSIIKNSLMNQTQDNVTCIFICFENFKKVLYNEDSLIEFDRIRKKIQSIENSSIKLIQDEDITFNNPTTKIYSTNEKTPLENITIGGNFPNESKDPVISSNNRNLDGKMRNLKVYKKFTNQQSELSRFNDSIINYTNNLKIAKNQRFSKDHQKNLSSNNGLYPSIDFTNVSIYNEKRRNIDENITIVKKLCNSVNKAQTTKTLKYNFK